MPASLDTLPFDLLHVIVTSLEVHEYVHLSHVSRRYHTLLQNECMARKTLQQTILYAQEAQKDCDSPDTRSSSRQALERVHIVRQSVASARPYSATLLAYGEVFVYSEGFLCYVDGPFVRVVDIHSASRMEEVIDVLGIDQRTTSQSGSEPFVPNEAQITSLSYSKRLLVCVCKAELLNNQWLLVIDLGLQGPKDKPKIIEKHRPPLRHRLRCTTKLFVRHNRSYLYYGTHSGLRSDGHHEWLLTGLDLVTGRPVTAKPFQLAGFVGSEIGTSACFELHEDSLFAVSNQTSFETEEIDWTSYYHCIKIPLGEKNPDLKAHPIWQRQHGEGPINDSWTDLSLRKDEQTNELLIIECRKEWLGGGSTNIRTCYTQPLHFSTGEDVMQMCKFPANDPLTKALDEHSKPHFSEPQKRIRKHFHHEYEQGQLDPRNPAPRDFILAKTNFRTYNPSAMSFIDLVSDPAPGPGSARMRDRLRLRIASRRQKSPLVPDADHPGHMLLRKPELDEKGIPIEGSEHDFHPTEIHLWPPDDAPAEIYDVLCPAGTVGNIQAVADDRSIMYMIDPPNGMIRRGRAIVMISFDPRWGRGLKDLVMPSTSPVGPAKELTLELPNMSSSRKLSQRASPAPQHASAAAAAAGPSQPKRQRCDVGRSAHAGQGGIHRRLMWQEEAMYLSINRGYRLR